MTKQLLRKAALAIVFAAGVGAIMATEIIPDTYITELSISPQYRCPGKDVRLKWATNNVAALSVEINNVPYELGEATEYLIPAEILDAVDYSTRLRFSLNDGPTDYPNVKWIQTYREAATVTQALQQTDKAGFEYRFRFEQGKWDQRLRGARVSIADQQCFNQDGWEARWRVKRPPRDTVALNAENGFRKNFGSPVPLEGEWIFVVDPVERASYEGKRFPPTCFEPRIEVSVVCADVSESE